MADKNESEAEFDPFSDAYDQAVNESIAFSGLKVDYFARVKAAYLLDLIAEAGLDAKTAALLDIGCGIGNYHPLLIDHVGSIAGTDVSSASLAEAGRRNPRVAYRHSTGETLPYADASFDVAFTVCVMHHVPEIQWPQFSREMRRVLKPGGIAVVFEHNPFNPLTRRIVSDCVFDVNAVLLRPSRTKALLRDAGFSAIAARHILTIPAGSPRLRGIDRLFSRLPLGAQYYVRGRA